MAHATVNFISDALRRPVTIDVIFPTDKMVSPTKYIPKKAPMKTLYFCEGSSGNYHRLLTHTMIEPIAEDNNICVVVVGGEDKWYANSDISGDYYGDLVTRDLVNFTRATFNLSDKAEDTYIGGFSMGGFGALTMGLRNSDLFGKIILHAPALCKALVLNSYDEPGHDAWTKTNYATMFGLSDVKDFEGSYMYDYELMVKTLAGQDKTKPEFIITSGEIDGLRPQTEKLVNELKEYGYDVTYEVVDGNHNWCVALNQGIKKAIELLPTDDFRDNFKQTEPESNYEWPDFFIWRAHYNTEDGKADLPTRMKGAIELSGYRTEDLGELDEESSEN